MRLLKQRLVALSLAVVMPTSVMAQETPSAPSEQQSTASEPVEAMFQEWLSVFNSGEKAAIQAFYGDRLDDPDAALALNIFELSCGFDFARVESRTASSMSVLLVERCFPALQRLQIEVRPADESKLARLDLMPFALPIESVNTIAVGLADRLAEQDEFAGSLLIARQDEPLVVRSWGTLGESRSAPVTSETPMFLASAGKMFTAVAVLQLVERGLVDLDAPLGAYLTDYPNAEMAKATPRQLLHHQGGAGDIGILARDEGENRARVRTLTDMLALNGDRAPNFAPGTRTEYSNYGFVLLGAIVERVTGQSYYDYVDEHIFAPADMTSAGFPDLENLEGVAIGSTTFLGEEEEAVSNLGALPWRGSPAGGGVASVNDMFKFLRALRSGELLSPAMFARITNSGDPSGFVLGFLVSSGRWSSWGHGGGSYGMSAAAHYYPGLESDFVCLSTRDMGCDRLINAWLPKLVIGLTE